MSVKLQITVTKEILERSMFCNTGDWECNPAANCAIALAVRDIFPDAFVETKGIFIGAFSYSRFNNIPADILIPKKAVTFIEEFDMADPASRAEMEPIAFEVYIPDSIVEEINIDEIRPLLINHPTLKLINHE